MDKYFLFSIFKQMRIPIITMIIYYAISVAGLILIPGVDDKGQLYDMGFFHAIYIVVYTSTTIGFGEIPYAWTENQRLWIMIISISGVVCWVYSMGKLIALSQNTIFKEKLSKYRFENQVKANKKPFYIMCGFGEAGKEILNLMNTHRIKVVLIDQNEKAFYGISSLIYKYKIPYIKADASNIKILKMAGLHMPNCKGVIVVSGDENINVQISISCKLLEEDKEIYTRAKETKNIKNLASFGTDYIISESTLFSKEISLLINNIEEHNLRNKLDGRTRKYKESSPLPKGKWVICGLNQTTLKVATQLINNNIDFVILTKKESENKLIKGYCIKSDGTSHEDLISAGVKDAEIIFASNEDDFKNLSTLITAKEINENIFTITIQNKNYRDDLFSKINIDIILQPQYKIASKIHSLISEPYLNSFYKQIDLLTKSEMKEILNGLTKDNLRTWHFRVNKEKSFFKLLLKDKIKLIDLIPIGHCIKTLMIERGHKKIINPKLNEIIKDDDVILFTGNKEDFGRHQLLMYNKNIYNEYKIRRLRVNKNG